MVTTEAIAVVAAVIDDGERFLVTRRQTGVHLEGYWEFPGGKVGSDETHAAALRREIREELDADVAVAEQVLTTTHTYPEKTVTLFFYRCSLIGSPTPLLGQEMKWVSRDGLAALEFPAADAELISLLTSGGPKGPPLQV